VVVLRPDLRVVFFLCGRGRNEESGRTGGRSWVKMLGLGMMGGVSKRLVVCSLALLLLDVKFRN